MKVLGLAAVPILLMVGVSCAPSEDHPEGEGDVGASSLWSRFLAESGERYGPMSNEGVAVDAVRQLDLEGYEIDCAFPPCIIRIELRTNAALLQDGRSVELAPEAQNLLDSFNGNSAGLRFRYLADHGPGDLPSRYALWAMPEERLSKDLLGELEEQMAQRLGRAPRPGRTWLQPDR